MILPTEIDQTISVCFEQHTVEGYQEGYEELKEIFGERYATFITFCYFLWDAECHQNAKEGLHLGQNFIRVILETYPIGFRDYRYILGLELVFFEIEHFRNGENGIYLGNYSRYQVGAEQYVIDCTIRLSKITGISWSGDKFPQLKHLN